MSKRVDLHTAAREFAADMSKLLNSTVTHGIKLSALTLNKAAVVGYKVSRNSPAPQTIPLTISKKPASLFLYIAHTLVVDEWHSFLANTKAPTRFSSAVTMIPRIY